MQDAAHWVGGLRMRTLIVQSNENLGNLWEQHLSRLGAEVRLASTGARACNLVQSIEFDVIVLDLMLSDGCALSVADFANFRQPSANVIFVTDTTFFSDGSIFNHSANARAFVESTTSPGDLAAIVQHYGATSRARVAHHS